MTHYVYILECKDGTLYTGYTNNLKKRLLAHNQGTTGAKYTRGRRPVVLIYSEKYKSKSKALKREWEIKCLKRKDKVMLINS